jgi:amino acid transporter
MNCFRRIWFVAFAVAAIFCVPVAFYSKTLPELISVPIILGTILVGIFEFTSEKRKKKHNSVHHKKNE